MHLKKTLTAVGLAAATAAVVALPAAPASAASNCWLSNWSYTAVTANCYNGGPGTSQVVLKCYRFGATWYVYGARHGAYTSWSERASCGSFPTALAGAWVQHY